MLLTHGEVRGLEQVFSITSQRVLDEIASAQRLAAPADTPVPCEDPADGWLLADAMQSGSDYFVTGDRLVLGLYAVGSMRIITPREAMDWLAQRVHLRLSGGRGRAQTAHAGATRVRAIRAHASRGASRVAPRRFALPGRGGTRDTVGK